MALVCSSLRSATAINSGIAPRPAKIFGHGARKTACKAYVEPSVTFAVTQQAIAYAVVLGGDAWFERNRTAAPDLKVIGAGAAGTLAAVAILNTGASSLTGIGLVVGSLASAAMFAYHIKRTLDAKDDGTVDWPGPKALPATMALASFFILSAFVQGIRAEL